MDSISLSLGIEVVLGTRVKSADVKQKTLLTATGETISYKFLIIATGARALKLEEFGLTGSDAGNVCYLRDLADATRLVDVMQSCIGGNAVVIGGGYIGMECAASLVINKLNVTMVFPEAHTKTTVKQIEEAFKEFTTREDIAIVMISQYHIRGTRAFLLKPTALAHVTAVLDARNFDWLEAWKLGVYPVYAFQVTRIDGTSLRECPEW
ncbi:hypothetical protein RHMOL_Rhmol05G0171300 [Rhododendron molle]|uniref:Uncharacterized protein n=1 Tax=Rhododendron molle TaxID=49168 RepID=A0ACC0NR76_RHOML|nr:hypothetical protein RHMOL_Rhmol05G0171300 [Rhododendron molle]